MASLSDSLIEMLARIILLFAVAITFGAALGFAYRIFRTIAGV